jgi:hypothetical protein
VNPREPCKHTFLRFVDRSGNKIRTEIIIHDIIERTIYTNVPPALRTHGHIAALVGKHLANGANLNEKCYFCINYLSRLVATTFLRSSYGCQNIARLVYVARSIRTFSIQRSGAKSRHRDVLPRIPTSISESVKQCRDTERVQFHRSSVTRVSPEWRSRLNAQITLNGTKRPASGIPTSGARRVGDPAGVEIKVKEKERYTLAPSPLRLSAPSSIRLLIVNRRSVRASSYSNIFREASRTITNSD